MTAPSAVLGRVSRGRDKGPKLPGVNEIILRLVWVIQGSGEADEHGNLKDRGLMSNIVEGEQHIERCQRGMWITPGLRGDPCSERCLRAQDALRRAAAWLYAHRPDERPAQPALPMDDVAG